MLPGDSQLLQHIDLHGVECRIQNNIACHACLLVFISKEHLAKHRDSNLCKANNPDAPAAAAKKGADVNAPLLKSDATCLKVRVTSEVGSFTKFGALSQWIRWSLVSKSSKEAKSGLLCRNNKVDSESED